MIRPNVTPRARALETARRQVLEQVACRGADPLAELATGWPHARHQTRLVVRDLHRDGLVTFARRLEDRAPAVALTDDGRRTLPVTGTPDPRGGPDLLTRGVRERDRRSAGRLLIPGRRPAIVVSGRSGLSADPKTRRARGSP